MWEHTRDGGNSPWSSGWQNPPIPAGNKWTASATFTQPGTYVIRALAHDGGLFTSQERDRGRQQIVRHACFIGVQTFAVSGLCIVRPFSSASRIMSSVTGAATKDLIADRIGNPIHDGTESIPDFDSRTPSAAAGQ